MAITLKVNGGLLEISGLEADTLFVPNTGNFTKQNGVYSVYDNVLSNNYKLGAYANIPQFTYDSSLHLFLSNFFGKLIYETPIDLYLYKTEQTPSITVNTSIDDETLTVDSTTGIITGNVITIFEGARIFQTIVSAATGTTITLQAPLDFAFTTAASIETGIWNMAVDGSSTTQIFSVKPPPLINFDIYQINVSMLDSSDMDDGKFGGVAALTKGLIFKFKNSITKHLAVIVNNLGFYEIGFTIEYSSKAPAGQYGFRARREIKTANGTTIQVEGELSDAFQVAVRDKLDDLDLLAVIINGHLK